MAIFTVTTTEDVVDAFDGQTSLREALTLANDTAGIDTITFASGTDDAFETGGVIRLTQGQLVITEGVTIEGGGLVTITGDANGDDVTVAGTDITDVAASFGGTIGAPDDLLDDNSRIFYARDNAADTGDIGTVTLNGLTLTGGHTNGGSFQRGAAVLAKDLAVNDSTLSGNSTAGADGQGGAIAGHTVSVNRSTISDNGTFGQGGSGGGIGVFGTPTATGDLTLTDSVVSGNSTVGLRARGGGISASNLELTNSTVSGNSTSGNGSHGGGIFTSQGSITNGTIVDNSTSGASTSKGGGLCIYGYGADFVIANSTFTGNSTTGLNSNGGGIFLGENGDLSFTNSLVLGNVSTQSGGDDLGANENSSRSFSGSNFVGGGGLSVFAQIKDNNGVTSGVLADNGGPVPTVALSNDASNPALDAGDDALASATDARGVVRDEDIPGVGNDATDFSDLGAFELQNGVVLEERSLVVTTVEDVIDLTDGETSLREAIALAGNLRAGASRDGDADNDGNSNDTITFDASLAGQTITLTEGALLLTSDVTIDGDIVGGDDIADITISGGNRYTVFSLESDTSTLDALFITGAYGVGLFVSRDANATVANSTFTESLANIGGGILNAGTLTVTNTTVSDNQAFDFGGGLFNYGTATVTDSTFSGNFAGYGGGGGLMNAKDATLEVENTTFSENRVGERYGGGLYNAGYAKVTNSTFSGNRGAGLFNNGFALVENTTFSENVASFGGGLANRGDATLTNSTFSGNSANYGGGVATLDLAETVIANSIVVGNTASRNGAEIFNDNATTNVQTSVTSGTASEVFAETTLINGVEAGVLADNGGPVQTIALRADAVNPALDAGDDDAAPETDARGVVRIEQDIPGIANNGTNVTDLGAFELEALVEAPSLVVTTAEDVVDDTDGETSLREALILANDLAAGGLGDGDADNDGISNDTITFDAALAGQTITLTEGALVLTSDVTIDGDILGGDDVADIRISGARFFRAFNAESGTSTFDALIIKGGYGGLAVHSDAIATVANSTISESTASNGGGISNAGILTVTDTTFFFNKGITSGGGLFNSGTATVTDSTFSWNSNLYGGDRGNGAGVGGGVMNARYATLEVENTTFSGNSTGDYDGGALYNAGYARVTNSTFSGNSAGQGGGIFNIGTALVENSTFSRNGGEVGGALANLGYATVTNSTFSGNEAGDGGAVATLGLAETFISNSIIVGNTARRNGDEIFDDNGTTNVETSITSGTGSEVFAETKIFRRVEAGVLADNGGPVQTIALLADAVNPALDAGDDDAAPETDARGALRLDQPGIDNNGTNISDLGAFELQQIVIVNTPPHALDDTFAAPILDPLILSLDVLENDTDDGPFGITAVGGQAIETGETVSLDSGARVTLTADGTLDYDTRFLLAGIDDPRADLQDTFTYTIDDGTSADSAKVTVALDGLDIGIDRKGGRQDDILFGHDRADLMKGRGGDDTMFGNAGNDRMFGNAGDDLVFGGAGNDVISGGRGTDTLFGGADNDALFGKGGQDELYGGDGNDFLTAARGGSLLDGGAGDDVLLGRGRSDTFVFNEGQDLIAFFNPDEDVLDLTAFGFADVDAALATAQDGFLSTTFEIGDDELTILGVNSDAFGESNVII